MRFLNKRGIGLGFLAAVILAVIALIIILTATGVLNGWFGQVAGKINNLFSLGG